MQYGAITANMDVAQLTLYAFWLFFAGLIIYLRREDHREGYPLVPDFGSQAEVLSSPALPAPKKFLLADGTVVLAPRPEKPSALALTPSQSWVGAPFDPTGNPMLDAVGPAAHANRADVVEHAYDDGLPKIVPLRTAADFYLATEDHDPRGYAVIGADGVVAGKIVDAWVDRSEYILRYLELELTGGMRHRLLPMHFADISAKDSTIRVNALLGAQFADVPALKNADTITTLEEDKVTAYYGGGLFYATPSRREPLL